MRAPNLQLEWVLEERLGPLCLACVGGADHQKDWEAHPAGLELLQPLLRQRDLEERAEQAAVRANALRDRGQLAVLLALELALPDGLQIPLGADHALARVEQEVVVHVVRELTGFPQGLGPFAKDLALILGLFPDRGVVASDADGAARHPDCAKFVSPYIEKPQSSESYGLHTPNTSPM